METRLRSRKSLAAAASEKSFSPAGTPRKSVRSRTPGVAEKDGEKSVDVAKSLKPEVSKSVTKRAPRTRRLSNASSEASPVRVTRSTKRLVPQETLRESESDDQSDTLMSTETSHKKDLSLVGPESPRTLRLSTKPSSSDSNRKLVFESSVDERFELSVDVSSAKKGGTSSPRIRQISVNSDDKKLACVISPKDNPKEPSPKRTATKNSPGKTPPGSPRGPNVSRKSTKNAKIPGNLLDESEDELPTVGSPRSRRASEKASEAVDLFPELKMDLSGDESIEPSSTVSSRKGTPRKSPEKLIPGSPRSRRASEKASEAVDLFPELKMDLSGDESIEPSSTVSSRKGTPRKSPEKLIPGSPRSRRASEKASEAVDSFPELKMDISGDESIVPSSTVSSRKGTSRKSPEKLIPGSPRSRRASAESSQAVDLFPELKMDLSEDESIELSSTFSSRKDASRKSPEKPIPGSPRSRRASEKPSNVTELTGKLVKASSADETNEPAKASTKPRKSRDKSNPSSPRSRRTSEKSSGGISEKSVVQLTSDGEVDSLPERKKDEARKSLEMSIISPRARELSEKSIEGISDKLIVALSSEDESNGPLTKPLPKKDKTRKSLEKSDSESRRARRLSKKSLEEKIPENSSVQISSDDEANTALTASSLNRDNTRDSLDRSFLGSPRTRKLSEKSPELRSGKLVVEVSEDEPEVSKCSEPQQRKSSETPKSSIPRSRKLSGSIVESATSESSSKKMSISEVTDVLVSSSRRKKNRRRKSSENSTPGLSRSRRLSEKSIDGSNADEDMLTLELSVEGKGMALPIGSKEASLDKKLREWQVSDLSASVADVSLNSNSVKTKSRKHRKRSKGNVKVATENEADDVNAKDKSSKTAESEVTVRRRGGGTIIESRPVFSDDAKYVYLNCGWGVRVFSVETGECVRVFDAFSKGFKVVNCFCWNTLPAALTSEGVFIAWDPRSGKIQQKVRLHVKATEMVLDGFFIPCEESAPPLCLVIECKQYTNLRMYSGSNFKSLAVHPLNARKVSHPYKQHSLSVGGDPKNSFIAYIDDRKGIRVVNMANKTFFRHSNLTGKYWNCVRAHPAEDTLAAGDSIGRIIVFRNLSSSHHGKNSTVNSVYHWHTLPVSEIAFTPAGSSMYSGGGELTLVKWNVENPQVRNFLPRMSADIVHIAISPYNQMVAVATLDNGVQIVTPTNKLQCILQQFSWSVIATEQERMFPSGLLYDPRSRGLILNSRPGHLQLYSPHSETLTYNIDITMMNYLTQERDKVIVNTQVTHSALTSDGLWLATVETRYEPGLALELRLKFWNYSNEKKRFILATVIDMPHDGQVHTIRFSPEPSKRASNESVEPESDVVLVSTGADRKMRLWSKTPIDSIYQKGETWRCQNACFYRDQPCGPCGFSYDGSVLAVGFAAALTLWDVENVVLKHSLARSSEHIKFVEFGREDCCNMLMCATESLVMAWDLLKLVLSWKVDLNSALFVADPYSSFLAVFTVDNQWKILDVHNGEVVSAMNSEGKSEVSDRPQKQQVLAAVFVPRHRPNPEAPKWMRNSYLYYIDVYQELNCLEPANEIAQLPTFQLAIDKDSSTLFGSLVGAKSVREKADEEHSKTMGYGVLGARAVTQLLGPAAHTLPPVNLLCGSFLQSFIILKRDNLPDESDRDDKSEDDKTTVIASSDSEQEVEMPTFSAPTSRPKKSAKAADRRPQSATPSESTPEPMDTESADLKKHFPLLDEDVDEPWRKDMQQQKDPSQLFVIED